MANDQQIKLERVRLSFPDIFKPKAVKEGDDPRYSAAFLIDKKTQEEQLIKLKAAIWGVAKGEWGDKAKELFHTKGKGKIHICLHEGEEKEYDGYDETNMFVTSSSSRRPMVVDLDRTPLTEDDRRPYAGCYVHAIIRLWAQKNNFGNRVNAELMGVQFIADGEPFGPAPLSEDAFQDESGGKDKPARGKTPAADEPGLGDDDDNNIPF